MSSNFSIVKFIRSQLVQSLPSPTTSLTGRTIIVTGSNTGLGQEAARHMARLGAEKLILAVRSTEKGDAARKSIMKSTGVAPSAIEVWPLDLQIHKSVMTFAERAGRLPRLDIALLNAGVVKGEWKVVEGDESTIATNVTNTFLLGMLLLPKLKDTAKEFPSDPKPILSCTSSDVHFFTAFPAGKEALKDGTAGSGGIFEKLNSEEFSKSQMGDRYNVSKLLEVYVIHEIGEQKPDYPVIINCSNPGLCHSELRRDAGWRIFFVKLALARSTEKGSRTLFYGAVDAGQESHGKYLSDCHVAETGTITTDEDGKRLQKAVWKELSKKLDAISPGVMVNL